jgi:hypothetical protein
VERRTAHRPRGSIRKYKAREIRDIFIHRRNDTLIWSVASRPPVPVWTSGKGSDFPNTACGPRYGPIFRGRAGVAHQVHNLKVAWLESSPRDHFYFKEDIMSEWKSITEHIRDYVLRRAGYVERSKCPPAPSYDELWNTQWCYEFATYMRNRLIMGFFRYGDIHKNNTTTEAKIASIRKRVDLYEQNGNLEHLVDIANIAMVEFMHSTHPKKHFDSVDDGTHITKEGK